VQIVDSAHDFAAPRLLQPFLTQPRRATIGQHETSNAEAMTNKVTFRNNESRGDTYAIRCQHCARDTKHEVVASCKRTSEVQMHDGDIDIDTDEYQLVRCRGCEYVSFREHSLYGNGAFEDEAIYPPRSIHSRETKRFPGMPAAMGNVYGQTIGCYNSDSLLLCAAGIRVLVEALCAHKGVADGPVPLANGTVKRKDNLEGKISGLQEKGFITADAAETLHNLRFLGNEALHEHLDPPRREVLNAIEILEHVLHQIFTLPRQGQVMKNARALRAK